MTPVTVERSGPGGGSDNGGLMVGSPEFPQSTNDVPSPHVAFVWTYIWLGSCQRTEGDVPTGVLRLYTALSLQTTPSLYLFESRQPVGAPKLRFRIGLEHCLPDAASQTPLPP